MHRKTISRTDRGTVLLHWLAVGFLLASLLTGLRIAADVPERTWINWVSFMLPGSMIWDIHIWSGMALTALSVAYVLYIMRAKLGARIRPDRVRLSGFWRGGPGRWRALNIILYWLLFAVLTAQFATGTLAYLGYGSNVMTLHYLGALSLLAFPVLHVLVHALEGGATQILRIFRPEPLPQATPQHDFTDLLLEQFLRQRQQAQQEFRAQQEFQANPLAVAMAAGVAALMAFASLDKGSEDRLALVGIESGQRPTIDGDLSDTAWTQARPITVQTNQGENFGGSKATRVEIRAVQDGHYMFLAFTWDDPTRSLKHLPLIKRKDGWHLLHTQYDIEDEDAYYEDKFAVMFAKDGDAGGAASAHLGKQPLKNMPASYGGRGLHYTDGAMLDVWHWKAARGGLLGYVDDNYFSTPKKPKPEEAEGKQRYKAGYATDEGKAFFSNNFGHESRGGYKGPLKPKRLPKDLTVLKEAMGRIDLDPEHGEEELARWWMTEAESEPYSEAADLGIPTGTVIPGILISGEYSGGRADVRGAARWSAGRWTLETSRLMNTGDKNDVAITSGVSLWVSAFDHSQTRHTRHVRPITLEVLP